MQPNKPSNYVVKTAAPSFLLWFLLTLTASFIAWGNIGIETWIIILAICYCIFLSIGRKLVVCGESCTYVPLLGRKIRFSMDDLKEAKIEPVYMKVSVSRASLCKKLLRQKAKIPIWFSTLKLAFYRKDGNWLCELRIGGEPEMYWLLDSLYEKGILKEKISNSASEVWKKETKLDPVKNRINILILGIFSFVQIILSLAKIDSYTPTIIGLCWILFVFYDRWRCRLRRLRRAYTEADTREGVITGFHQPEGRVVSYPCFQYEDEEGEHEKESYYGFKIPEEEKEKYIGKKYVIRCSDEMNVVFFLSGEDKWETISETDREATVVRGFLAGGETKKLWRTMPELDEELEVDETKQ